MKWTLCSTNKKFRRQFTAAFIASLGMVHFGYICGWTASTVEFLTSDNSPVTLTSSQLSWIVSATSLGAMMSPIPCALLLKKLGRRSCLYLLNILPVMSWIFTYYSTNFFVILMARILAGNWTSSILMIVPLYIAEVAEPKSRSSLNNLINIFWYLGCILMFTVSLYVSYWTLSVIGLVLSLKYWCLLLIIPESPYYYCIKNQREKAVESLRWLRGDENIEEELSRIEKFVESELKSEAKLKKVFSNPGHLKAALIVITSTMLARASGRSLQNVLPIILPKNAFWFLSNLDCMLVLAYVNFICSCRIKLITDLGIKVLLTVCSIICGLSMGVMAVREYFKSILNSNFVENDLYWVPFICFLVYFVAYSIGVHPVLVGFRGEMFPTELKGILGAISIIFGNTSGFLILKSFFFIQENFGSYFNFVIASTAGLCLFLFALFYVLETEGKSLEQIQAELNSATKTNKQTGSSNKDDI